MWLLTAAASGWAGYGDAGPDFPTVRGRQVATWVNAARVEPSAFETEYLAGGCTFAGFLPAEQVPRAPYRWDAGLAEVALSHSLDMSASGLFQHDSSDGTPWSTRVWGAYPGGSIAENIALGYTSAKSTVLRTWMCSTAGHRASILSATYEDFGGDMVGSYATADFGAGAGGAFPAISMGSHEPVSPRASVDFSADWTGAAAPDTFDVVFDGVAVPLTLAYGAADQGVYQATNVAVDASPCHPYWFRATLGGVESRFPETGSYSFGTCAGASAATGFLAGQAGPITVVHDTASFFRGSQVTVTVSGAAPGSTVGVGGATLQTAGPCLPALGGTCVDIDGSLRLLGTAVADPAGVAVVVFTVPAALPVGLQVWTQAAVADQHGNWFVGAPVGGQIQ